MSKPNQDASQSEIKFPMDIQSETTNLSNDTDYEIGDPFLSQSVSHQLQSPFDSNHKTPCMVQYDDHISSQSHDNNRISTLNHQILVIRIKFYFRQPQIHIMIA